MNRFRYLGAALVLLAAGFCGGAFWGVRFASFQSALAENKIATVNLDSSSELNPQFREYLKARIYSNILQFYPSDQGYLLQKDWDRGPVNRDVLGGLVSSKDPTAAAWDWQSALADKLR